MNSLVTPKTWSSSCPSSKQELTRDGIDYEIEDIQDPAVASFARLNGVHCWLVPELGSLPLVGSVASARSNVVYIFLKFCFKSEQ